MVHRVPVPDVERVHQGAVLVGEKADGEVEPAPERLGDVRRVDAHRDHIDPKNGHQSPR